MQVAVTGGTGFIGRYLLEELLEQGHEVRALKRASSQLPPSVAEHPRLTWLDGDLATPACFTSLLEGCEGVVHAALWRPGTGFRGAEGDIPEFVEVNVVGTLRLLEAARKAQAERFVFVSTCAVHEEILEDRPLDEKHPVWPKTHYGAHKGAIECFVHSYGKGAGYPICGLRPSGVYGRHHEVRRSKWFELIEEIVEGKPVQARRGGKEVHARDVARACLALLTASEAQITGEIFNCCDRYISHFEVAELARELSGSQSPIEGEVTRPKHQIATDKLESLGFAFGGEPLWRATVEELLQAAQAGRSAANK